MKKFISGLIFGIFLPIFIIPLLDSTAQYLINAIAIKSSKKMKSKPTHFYIKKRNDT